MTPPVPSSYICAQDDVPSRSRQDRVPTMTTTEPTVTTRASAGDPSLISTGSWVILRPCQYDFLFQHRVVLFRAVGDERYGGNGCRLRLRKLHLDGRCFLPVPCAGRPDRSGSETNAFPRHLHRDLRGPDVSTRFRWIDVFASCFSPAPTSPTWPASSSTTLCCPRSAPRRLGAGSAVWASAWATWVRSSGSQSER